MSSDQTLTEFVKKAAPSIRVTLKCHESALKYNTYARGICGLPSFIE